MRKSTLLLLVLMGLSLGAQANEKLSYFPQPQTDFQAHITEVKAHLLATQMRGRNASDVSYNLPFEQSAKPGMPYRGQFLLIHGLNDSPYVFSDVADELSERGFDVRAILLPGHGNTPEAQLTMTHRRWLQAARQHLNLWKTENTPMYLGGFSMGSVIATILALENEGIEGLLLFSPAFKSQMNHLLRWSSIYSHFKPWVFGGMIREDNPTKYNSIPVNGAAQYYKLTKVLKKTWAGKQLDMPVLAIASENDSVVDVEFFSQVFKKRFTSEKKRLLIYSNFVDGRDTKTTEYRPSAYPKLRILNQSHQGVIIAPDNPLFGYKGSVLVCNGNDWTVFSACLFSNNGHWFGAQHSISPDTVPVARVTYNPDFAGVFAEFDKVFN